MKGFRTWVALAVVGLAALSLSVFPGLASSPDFLNLGSEILPDGLGDLLPLNGDDDDEDEDEDDQDEADDEDGEADEDDEDNNDEDDEDNDEEDEDEDDEREVTVNIDEETNEVSIRLESKSPDREDEIKVGFEAPEGQMKVSLEREAASEEEVEMRITFHRLVEFVDEDGNGAFEPLDEDLVQEFLIEELPVVDLASALFESDGGTGYAVWVNYSLPGSPEGRFGLVFWVFGHFAFVNGVPVGPSETKIDIHIEGFPFQEEGSAVAVDLRIRTEFEVETVGITLDEILARGEAFAAFFRWSAEAEVDGITQPVHATVVRQEVEAELEAGEGEFENRTRLFLAYGRGSEIIHDPTVGVLAIPIPFSEGFPIVALGIGLASALVLVGAVSILTRRRR